MNEVCIELYMLPYLMKISSKKSIFYFIKYNFQLTIPKNEKYENTVYFFKIYANAAD